MIKIIIQTEDNSKEIWRKYDWEADGNFEDKGKAIEDMIEALNN